MSQYYYYSKGFTRLIAALMVNCEDDLHRSKLSENLWEEGGETDSNKRHSELFKQFMSQHLKMDLTKDIKFEEFTISYFNCYLNMCLHGTPLESAAILSFGTESIILRLYSIFRLGLLQIGFNDDSLKFFNLHIKCDDEHAAVIEEIVLSYASQEDWFDICSRSICRALDVRDLFFQKIYDSLSSIKLNQLISKITCQNAPMDQAKNAVMFDIESSLTGDLLYMNILGDKDINFKVNRLLLNGDVLDPRLVWIEPGCMNELHRHAHETVILVLDGNGELILDDQSFTLKKGSVFLVPRWSLHQIRNLSNKSLRFFAVTDFGFTKHLPGNTESSYRLKAD